MLVVLSGSGSFASATTIPCIGEASVQSAIVVACMTEYDLTLRLKLHSTLWPEGIVSSSVLLPRSWCTAEITGPSEQLIRVPDRKREQRSKDSIRWQMGPDELDQGALVDWLRQTEAVFHGAQSGPYR